ncbi:hypothetical protein [Bosea sp. (in: a-proteobacteria)]|uniref:hypothetical protein n=1 Tax=Bosea sp. (in: a-proteobacteria) TaxID=1871050 RepID=UPI003B3B5575
MGEDRILWLAPILLLAVPIGLALGRYWASSRAPGVVRLDGAGADPKGQIEPTLEHEDAVRIEAQADQR